MPDNINKKIKMYDYSGMFSNLFDKGYANVPQHNTKWLGPPVNMTGLPRKRYIVSRPPRQSRFNKFKLNSPHYFDSARTGDLNVTASWAAKEFDPPTLDSLFQPVEGDDIENRDGRVVTVTKIQIKGLLSTSADTALNSPIPHAATRLVLVMDQQTNGVQMNSEDLFEGLPTATLAYIPTSFQNKAFFGRFRVLKDKVLAPPRSEVTSDTTVNTVGIVEHHQPFRITHKFKGKGQKVRFNATNGGTIADIVDNSFHFIVAQSSATQLKTLTYSCRVYFKDG